jgi:hypothetical protein
MRIPLDLNNFKFVEAAWEKSAVVGGVTVTGSWVPLMGLLSLRFRSRFRRSLSFSLWYRAFFLPHPDLFHFFVNGSFLLSIRLLALDIIVDGAQPEMPFYPRRYTGRGLRNLRARWRGEGYKLV